MTGNEAIREAKLIYSVELGLSGDIMVSLLNQARERVNRLLNLSYKRETLQTASGQKEYLLSYSYYKVYRCLLEQPGGLLLPLKDILEDSFLFTNTGIPMFYSFRPMNRLMLFPIPEATWNVFIYGNSLLDLHYNANNLDVQDVIPDYLKHAVALDLAKRLAEYDQQYELSAFLEQQFLSQLREMKL